MRSLRSRPPHLGGVEEKSLIFFGEWDNATSSMSCFGACAAAGTHGRGRPCGKHDGCRTKKKRPGRRRVPASRKVAASYSPACAVPSATAGLTSLFGMGRGGSPSL